MEGTPKTALHRFLITSKTLWISFLLPTPYSLFPVPSSLFPAPCSLLPFLINPMFTTQIKMVYHYSP
ncbi:hypothetical protein [Moorena sp. SIO4G3]|uniref:hypothetical protein n=1 Tax=Moorena sp. SIO4G3 TaxID=2607821 RepID=UPI00142BA08D|nr:hypothetical protein [Moorena sp. SIO4G3]NEO75059.1 hypothetical protein [Moorena sp. SIO4G3]